MIGFIKTPAGKWMVVEPELVDGSDLEDTQRQLITEDGELILNPEPFQTGYLPHWPNCSGSDQARSRANSWRPK